MKQTVEEAARKELFSSYACTSSKLSFSGFLYNADAMLNMFQKGAEWKAEQSPWISVKERLPKEGQRILVGFFYRYKYADREAESREHVDFFTYENGIWTNDINRSYRGKEVSRDDIKVICWMPIPSFDDILKANKDVLERIKEKGD